MRLEQLSVSDRVLVEKIIHFLSEVQSESFRRELLQACRQARINEDSPNRLYVIDKSGYRRIRDLVSTIYGNEQTDRFLEEQTALDPDGTEHIIGDKKSTETC